jgi:hypothetical protein
MNLCTTGVLIIIDSDQSADRPSEVDLAPSRFCAFGVLRHPPSIATVDAKSSCPRPRLNISELLKSPPSPLSIIHMALQKKNGVFVRATRVLSGRGVLFVTYESLLFFLRGRIESSLGDAFFLLA